MTPSVSEPIHIWYRCHACGAEPIVGVRFECQVCPAGPDTSLCEACHRLFEQGRVKHPPPSSRETSTLPHKFRAFDGLAREPFMHWISVPWPSAPAPTVPDRFVVRPEFRSGHDSFFGSYGFVVAGEDGRGPLMLTALHVLDELVKLKGIDCSEDNAAYTGHELPRHVTGVQLYDVFAPNWMLAEVAMAGPMLVLPDARIFSEEPYSQRDIAAFRIAPSAPVQPGRLSVAPPTVGEPIWLAANLGRGARERALQAVVVEITERTLIFRFAKPVVLPPYTSGAPLLNRAGEVVGINIGGGMLDGYRLGHANHVASVRRHLGW